MNSANLNQSVNEVIQNSILNSNASQMVDTPNTIGNSVVIANCNDFMITSNAEGDNELGHRTCWICFASEEDNHMAAWVQPCKCKGTTKWVHQSCLYRWIDEKQKGNALRPVTCQQCQTEYIIVFPQMGTVANLLEAVDNLIKRLSPFLGAGIFVGSIYWTAVTYGAVTFLQIVGHKKGLALMENGDPLVLLIGLPAIPVGLVLSRFIRWEDAVLRMIRDRNNVARKFPFIHLLIPIDNEEDESSQQNPATPALTDPVSATRVICGALLLPTISTIVGRILFDSIDNTLHRTLLGGLTYITVKGILKIYLKHQQYNRKKKRHILNYTDDNIRHYVTRVGHAVRHHRGDIILTPQRPMNPIPINLPRSDPSLYSASVREDASTVDHLRDSVV